MSERQYQQRRSSQVEDMGGTLLRLSSYLKKYWLHILIVVVCLTASAYANVASSSFAGDLVDYLTPLIGVSNPDLAGFTDILVHMAIIYSIGVISNWVYQKLMSLVSTGILHDVRMELFAHMEKMPVQFYDTHTHGELMSFYTNDVDMMRPFIAQTLPQLYSTLYSVITIIIMMFSKNVTLTIVTLIILGIICFITYFLAKFMRKFFVRMQKANSDINGYCEEMFLGQKVVKVFCHEPTIVKDFDVYNKEATDASIKSNIYSGMVMPINQNLAYVSYALIAVVGANMCIQGKMTLGALTSFLLYSRQISGPISMLSQQINGVMMSIAGAERVFKVLDMPTEVDEGKITLVNAVKNEDGSLTETTKRTGTFAWKNPEDNTLTELKGDVRLKNVTFSYNPDKIILKNVSLYAKPGQKIAFVGSTGAGKTTITNLINRFYDVQQGEITYDGIDIKKIKKASLRSSLGVVLQDTNLFSGTVMDNIRYGRLDATDEECITAAKTANADSFISRLPNGYQTMLTSNGANLSQGQRQLLNIARAEVANTPVMILDEATSSIDTHTEKLIERGMDQLMKGRTVFVIAHRLSTVRNSNAIIVLEHGEIMERGTHEELLANKDRYYQLYTGKAELD